MQKRVKILLADDSVTMHRAVRLALKNEPFDIVTCDNGQDALRLALEHLPNVLLADLDMPGLTGPELTAAVKAHPALTETRVVLLCGSFDQFDESRLADVKADARLWKPFESHALVTMIQHLLKTPVAVFRGSEPGIQDAKGLRISSEATGALPEKMESAQLRFSSEPTAQNLEKELTAETFQVAETGTHDESRQSALPPSSTSADRIAAQIRNAQNAQISSAESTLEQVGAQKPHMPEKVARTEEVRISANPTWTGPGQTSLGSQSGARPAPPPQVAKSEAFSDEWATQEINSEQANLNLWSDDFNVEASGPDMQSVPGTNEDLLWQGGIAGAEALKSSPPSSDTFEIVTSSIDLHQAPLDPPLKYDLGETNVSAEMDPPLEYNPEPLENLETTESAQLISADDWARDQDFSQFQSEELLAPSQAAPPAEIDSKILREIVKEEIDSHLKVWVQETVRNMLQEQLQKVMQEIDRE